MMAVVRDIGVVWTRGMWECVCSTGVGPLAGKVEMVQLPEMEKGKIRYTREGRNVGLGADE